MNKLSIKKRAQIVGLLVEGNSLRATSRLADCSINTVTKLLVDTGTACAEYQDKAVCKLPCRRIQCDGVWSFCCYAKQKNAREDKQGIFGYGDVCTWIALCADTQLIAGWMIGNRDGAAAKAFINDLAGRFANRVQLTTAGHRAYLEAVEGAFGGNIDYGQLVNVYGERPKQDQRRYSPSEFVCASQHKVTGNPDEKHVSASFVKRQNLTMRMSMRRFTRPASGFSKKIENHMHAIALHVMHYNFGRIHKNLRVAPAMEAGITDHVWSLEEIAALVPAPTAGKHGPYKKRNSN